jgi:glycerol-3-phosphate dehydrogenase
MFDVAIIGCGVIGAATAYELSRYDQSVVILEAKNDVADATTKANSAILHAGYDPEPGTAMARLNVRGVELAAQICERLDVGYDRCGSLVVALSDDDLPMLQTLYERGVANGVPGVEILDAKAAHEKEPALAETIPAALWAPSAAIVNPWEYAIAMAEVAVRNGVELRLRAPVTAIERIDGGYRLSTPQGEVEARTVVNASGVNAAQVQALVADPGYHITPTRGQYWLLDHSAAGIVNTVVFQCPNEKGKGVLVSPTVHGNVIVGPDAEALPDDQATNTACTAEGQDFVAAQARLSIPTLDLRDNIRNFAGIRANVDSGDFIIGEAEGLPGWVNLAGMKSPGLSCAPAVAEEARSILEGLGVIGPRKEHYQDGRRHVRFAEATPEERAALIAEDPAYGHIICRCETVTEAEIVAALHEEIPATTIDGVKRRAGSGMGRCQGGFCGPRVLELICRELGLDPLEVLQDEDGSYVLDSEAKRGA